MVPSVRSHAGLESRAAGDVATDPVLVIDGDLVVVAASAAFLEADTPQAIGRCVLDALPLVAGPPAAERLRRLLVSLRSTLEARPGRTMAIEIVDVSRSARHAPAGARSAHEDEFEVLDGAGAVVYRVRVATFDEADTIGLRTGGGLPSPE